jgi:malonyl-CoA O-methyltransferase
MTGKEIIKNNFSRHARSYDRYSGIQRLCAAKLITATGKEAFRKILDIGCGTGILTALLRRRFPNAEIRAIDISGEMLEVAKGKLRNKNIDFARADGERINPDERFDLISSNASFQWFDDLGKAFAIYGNALKKDGMILFSIFGPETFRELGRSLKALLGKDTAISSSFFPGEKRVSRILNRYFRDVNVKRKIYKRQYKTLPELLKKIKYSGVRGNGANRDNPWSSRMLCELEKIYRDRFCSGSGGEIDATYEVLFCRGRK